MDFGVDVILQFIREPANSRSVKPERFKTLLGVSPEIHKPSDCRKRYNGGVNRSRTDVASTKVSRLEARCSRSGSTICYAAHCFSTATSAASAGHSATL